MSVPHISRPVLWFFRRIVRGYFRRHFTAVRVSEVSRWASLSTSLPAGPVIVYANHTSWWDPMVSVLLAKRFMPGRKHFAPMDAAALERYPILKQVGVFAVEQRTARGAAQFLRTGLAILKSGGVVWITPQGRFSDVRESLEFKPGLAALAGRVPGGCSVLPLAIEYTFWDERLPETLLHFGEPIRVAGEVSDEQLKLALAEAMETLRAKAVARDPAGFAILMRGRVGVGGFYQAGQRMVARLRGRKYRAEHTAVPVREER